MRKFLLTTAGIGGILTLTAFGATAAPVGPAADMVQSRPHSEVTQVNWYWHHHYWHHREWHHGWRYW